MNPTTEYYRLELIANHTVQEAVFEALGKLGAGKYWTLLRDVDGCGSSGSRMGDGVWPEENYLMVLYADLQESNRIAEAIREVKSLYPIEGIKLFRSPAECLV